MDQRDDQRTEELNELRLAPATYALRLDAFEARLKSRLVTNGEPLNPVPGAPTVAESAKLTIC